MVVKAPTPMTTRPRCETERVRDEPLHVVLRVGHEGAVDDADDAEHAQPRREPEGRVGEEGQREPQVAVHAQLQEDAGEDDRARRRGLGVGVREPGVEREDGHLDRERQREGEEEERLEPTA